MVTYMQGRGVNGSRLGNKKGVDVSGINLVWVVLVLFLAHAGGWREGKDGDAASEMWRGR